jgi:uncharacterized protein (TIGR03084 family)
MASETVLDDLRAEYDELDGILAALDDASWDRPTPAAGWTVRDQVSHLAYSEELAGLAATDADAFGARLEDLLADLERADREPRERARDMTPAQLLDWWRAARAATVAALEGHDAADRIPWVASAMSVTSFATARLMETWAHGQDVVDAVGVTRVATDRLRHVAHLGVSTRGFSYLVRGRTPPDLPVRVELLGPGGDTWEWGPPDAPDRVAGSAEDFCLVVTQRRHPDDTDLVVEGAAAEEWIGIAQAFAGPPTGQRAPLGQPAGGRP